MQTWVAAPSRGLVVATLGKYAIARSPRKCRTPNLSSLSRKPAATRLVRRAVLETCQHPGPPSACLTKHVPCITRILLTLASTSSYTSHQQYNFCRCAERLAFKRLIGRGYASRVWECIDHVNGARRAVKVYRKRDLCALNLHQIQREALIHGSIAHPCVLPFFGSFSDVDHVYMILDYCAKGDLYNYLRAKRRSLTDSQVRLSTAYIGSILGQFASHSLLLLFFMVFTDVCWIELSQLLQLGLAPQA